MSRDSATSTTAGAAAQPLLDVDRVTVRFGGLVAVSDLDLDVPAGSVVSVIGPNGAGKTTAFNCISGIYPPASGTVRFRGRRLERSLTAGTLASAAGIGLPGLDQCVGNDGPGTVGDGALDDDARPLSLEPGAAVEGEAEMEEGTDGLEWRRPAHAEVSIGVACRPRTTMSKRYPSAHSGLVRSKSKLETMRRREAGSGVEL